MGLDVGDRQATDRAIAELWKECIWRSVDGLLGYSGSAPT